MNKHLKKKKEEEVAVFFKAGPKYTFSCWGHFYSLFPCQKLFSLPITPLLISLDFLASILRVKLHSLWQDLVYFITFLLPSF